MRLFRLFALLVVSLMGLTMPLQASAHKHSHHGHGREFKGGHWGHRHGGPAPRVVVIDRGIHLPAPRLGLPRPPGLPNLPLPPLPRLPLP
jgi:hypothetical protein